MRRFIKSIGLFFLPLLLAVGMVFFLPLPKPDFYQYLEGDCWDRSSWIYPRMQDTSDAIDVAFLGTSKTMHAVQDSLLNGWNAANLGYCRLGRNLHYHLASELLSLHDPDLLVLEIRADENEKGHPMYAYMANSRDLLWIKHWFHPGYFKDLYLGLETRILLWKQKLLGVEYREADINSLFGYTPSQRIIDTYSWEYKRTVEQKKWQDGKAKTSLTPGKAYNLAYIETIAERCNEEGVSLAFLYLPNPGGLPKQPMRLSWYEQFGTVLVPPDSIFQDRRNWMDPDHLNDRGAFLLTQWLVEQDTAFYGK